MYATAINPRRPSERRDQNRAPVAGVGGSDATANSGPSARTASDHWRGRSRLPHLANRRDAAPHGAFGCGADREPEAGSRATLLPERDRVATDLSTLVRSAGGGLGIRNPAPPGWRRAWRVQCGTG